VKYESRADPQVILVVVDPVVECRYEVFGLYRTEGDVAADAPVDAAPTLAA
jgi:hypothetical protein